MTDLSPAAQAVYEAAWSAYWIKDAEHPADAETIAAAALRAVASVSRRGSEHWPGMSPDDYDNGWDAALDYIIDLAAELENQ